MLRSQNINYILLSMLMDFFGTALALVLAQKTRLTLGIGHDVGTVSLFSAPIIAMVLVIWCGTFITLSVYDPDQSPGINEHFMMIFVSLSVSMLILAGMLYFTFRDVSRLLMIYFYGYNLLILLGWRVIDYAILRLLGKQIHRHRRVVIIGDADNVVEVIQQQRNIQIVGFLDQTMSDALGTLDDIGEVVNQHQIDTVIIALPMHAHHQLTETVLMLHTLSVEVWMVADYLNLTLSRIRIQHFDDLVMVNLRAPMLSSYQRLIKRAFDVIIAGITTLMLLPLMIIIAVLIRLDSTGEIIFKQKRVGQNGRLFTMYKFRSMLPDAENRRGEVIYQNEAGEIIHKVSNHPHVTRVGAFLRRTSLDELPQLFNVLKGDMSLVGPRPEMPWLVEKYDLWQRKRFTVPPGITGWWQINGRSERPMHLHTEDDIYYIQHYSAWFDLYILLKTIPAVLSRKGAY